MAYFTWTVDGLKESLFGVLAAPEVPVFDVEKDQHYLYDLISLGFIFFRIDILMNKREIENE